MKTILKFSILTLFSSLSIPAISGSFTIKINGVECTVIAPDSPETRSGKRASTKKNSSNIAYTQATISDKYTNGPHAGQSVNSTPKSAVATFDPIRVFSTNPNSNKDWECNEEYSLDNRRLWVAKKYNEKLKTTSATEREILDAIEDRKSFLVFTWDTGSDIESCESDEIYFDKSEAKANCFDDESESSTDSDSDS